MTNEQVLVVNAALLAPFAPEGYTPLADPEPLFKLILAEGKYLDREYAEKGVLSDGQCEKQIIPYVLVRHGHDYLMMQRTKKQGEQRLWGKFSLGVGGHIHNQTPLDGYRSIIWASAYRELDEEIKLVRVPELAFKGTLRYDSDSVGQVHLGLVCLAEVDSDQFTIGEPDMMTAQWMTVEGLAGYYDRMENWSRVLYRAITGGLLV